MKNDMSIIIKNFLCFFLKCLLPVLVVGLIYFDIKTFGDIREKSFVELGQSVFLFAASVIFMYLANKKKANGLWLVAGFFVCMLIREQDAYFYDIFHGFFIGCGGKFDFFCDAVLITENDGTFCASDINADLHNLFPQKKDLICVVFKHCFLSFQSGIFCARVA